MSLPFKRLRKKRRAESALQIKNQKKLVEGMQEREPLPKNSNKKNDRTRSLPSRQDPTSNKLFCITNLLREGCVLTYWLSHREGEGLEEIPVRALLRRVSEEAC